jgi:hypothetical protein
MAPRSTTSATGPSRPRLRLGADSEPSHALPALGVRPRDRTSPTNTSPSASEAQVLGSGIGAVGP